MLNEEQTTQFARDGYLVFERFFEDTECAAFKADIDTLEADRKAGIKHRVYEYPQLGPLVSHPRVMDVIADVMGPDFAFHHLHAVRQDAGASGVPWHQDYEQEPQTNRSHLMAHFFYYFNGLNGTIGDLLLIPGTQKRIVANEALSVLQTADLPGTLIVDKLPSGSAVLVHSALWHARRAKPGGENTPRYFADASYCQAGVRWPAYGEKQWRELLVRMRELGLDRDGRYAHLFDESHFFDQGEAHKRWKDRAGSIAFELISPS